MIDSRKDSSFLRVDAPGVSFKSISCINAALDWASSEDLGFHLVGTTHAAVVASIPQCRGVDSTAVAILWACLRSWRAILTDSMGLALTVGCLVGLTGLIWQAVGVCIHVCKRRVATMTSSAEQHAADRGR